MKAIPANLRLLNQQRIIERMHQVGRATRASLADDVGVSRPTAGKIIDDLLDAGVLQEGDLTSVEPARERGVGRPGRPVMLDARTPRLILIELGVARTSLAAVTLAPGNEVDWTHRFATPRSGATWYARLRGAVADLRVRKPWAFAISIPGAVDEQAGRVLLAPNLHWLERDALLDAVAEIVGAPGTMVQEVRALARGHSIASRGDDDFFWVEMDQGLGGAAMIRGRVFEGAVYAAGELGHSPIPGNTRLCGCGARGCIETLLSRRGLIHTVLGKPALSDRAWSETVARLARQPLPPTLRDHIRAGGGVIAGALNVLGLGRVILSGTLGVLPAEVQGELSGAIRANALSSRFGGPISVEVGQPRRALGLVTLCLERLVGPTRNWRHPCVP